MNIAAITQSTVLATMNLADTQGYDPNHHPV